MSFAAATAAAAPRKPLWSSSSSSLRFHSPKVAAATAAVYVSISGEGKKDEGEGEGSSAAFFVSSFPPRVSKTTTQKFWFRTFGIFIKLIGTVC